MRAVPFVLLLLAFAAPGTLAQLPTTQPCGPLEIPNAPAVPAPVAAGGSVEVLVEVRNAGPIAMSVTVTAATSSPGWQVAASPPAASVASAQTATFAFTITATGSAVDDATIQFAASGACETPQGLPCPANACTSTANTQVQVPLQPEEGFTFPGLGSLGLGIEYLLAGIVLVGLAAAIPFAMRRKKSGVSADCPEPLKLVRPGRGTSFPIEIRNGAKEAATAHFEVSAVPEGWSAFMPLPEVQLAARESRSLWLMVRAPQEAKVGDAVDIELRLKDARGVSGPPLRVRAEVSPAGADA